MRASHRLRMSRTDGHSTGALSVELALLLPLLAMLLFGCIEMGAMFNDWLVISQVARDACRRVSVGGTTIEVQAVIAIYAGAIRESDLETTLQYRSWGGGDWGDWAVLTDVDGENAAYSGDQLRVALSYRHPLLTGSLLSALAGRGGRTEVTLPFAVIARRE